MNVTPQDITHECGGRQDQCLASIGSFHEKVLAIHRAMEMRKMKTEFAGAGEWEREFGFLREFGLECVYLNILILALNKQEKSEIRRQVNLLPDYARLLRQDLIKFEKFWQKYRLDFAMRTWALESQYPEARTAKGYYLRALRNGSSVVDCRYESPGQEYVVASEKTLGRGISQFEVRLFGQTFHVWCQNTTLPEKLMDCTPETRLRDLLVGIFIDRDQLTEELAHSLLSLPYRDYRIGMANGGVVLHYPIDRERTIDGQGIPELPEEDGYPVATPEFLRFVSAVLKEYGVPIEGDIQPRFAKES